MERNNSNNAMFSMADSWCYGNVTVDSTLSSFLEVVPRETAITKTVANGIRIKRLLVREIPVEVVLLIDEHLFLLLIDFNRYRTPGKT
jgi:hypothetical protein